jgi:hypothetical protein
MSNHTASATCLCGDVRWEVDAPVRAPSEGPLAALALSHCHCSRCRKAHGSSFATYLVVDESRFRLTHGHAQIERYKPEGAGSRPFCRRCGSVVPDGVAAGGVVAMPAGPFDDDFGLRPMAHIFVGSKAPWVTITDGLPQFDEYPPELGAPGMATRAPSDPYEGHPRGSCLCGEVAYVVESPALRARYCHCSRCRKAYSSAYASGFVTSLDGVRFTRGEERLVTYKVPEAESFEHRFCATCGSSMPRRVPARGVTVVPMGSFDDDPGVRPSCHIFVASRAPWVTITDGLPQYDAYPPA